MVFQVLFEILKQYLFILFSRFRAFHPTSLNLQIAKKIATIYSLRYLLNVIPPFTSKQFLFVWHQFICFGKMSFCTNLLFWKLLILIRELCNFFL